MDLFKLTLSLIKLYELIIPLITAISTLIMAIFVALQAYHTRQAVEETSKQTKIMYESQRLETVTRIGESLGYLGRKFVNLYAEGLRDYWQSYKLICNSNRQQAPGLSGVYNLKKILEASTYLEDIILLLDKYSTISKQKIQELKDLHEEVNRKATKLNALLGRLVGQYNARKCNKAYNLIKELDELRWQIAGIINDIRHEDPLLIVPLTRELNP